MMNVRGEDLKTKEITHFLLPLLPAVDVVAACCCCCCLLAALVVAGFAVDDYDNDIDDDTTATYK